MHVCVFYREQTNARVYDTFVRVRVGTLLHTNVQSFGTQHCMQLHIPNLLF